MSPRILKCSLYVYEHERGKGFHAQCEMNRKYFTAHTGAVFMVKQLNIKKKTVKNSFYKNENWAKRTPNKTEIICRYTK